MDRIDRRILSILQREGQISMARLSEQVGLSLSACHRRVKTLETEGVISHYAARLDRRAVGLEIEMFVEVRLDSRRKESVRAFERAVARMDEVLECHLISGEYDYLIRVAARSAAEFETLYRDRLSELPSVMQMKTLMSLSTVKEFEGYDLGE